MNIESFQEHFKPVEDPRQGAKVRHPLFDVLFGTLCAVISGAKGWHGIREYVLGHHDRFMRHELFKLGVPVDDTFARIISNVEPEPFRESFLVWMKAVYELTEGNVVAIDGKRSGAPTIAKTAAVPST